MLKSEKRIKHVEIVTPLSQIVNSLMEKHRMRDKLCLTEESTSKNKEEHDQKILRNEQWQWRREVKEDEFLNEEHVVRKSLFEKCPDPDDCDSGNGYLSQTLTYRFSQRCPKISSVSSN